MDRGNLHQPGEFEAFGVGGSAGGRATDDHHRSGEFSGFSGGDRRLAVDGEHLENLEQDILSYTSESPCNNVGDCRYIGMGANPCGGPFYYLVYSTSNVDTLILSEMVLEHNQFNDELNERFGLAGPCVVPNIPNLDCVDGQCIDLGYLP